MSNPRKILFNKEVMNEILFYITESEMEILLMRFIDGSSLRRISNKFKLGGRPEAEIEINRIIMKVRENLKEYDLLF